MNHTTYVRSSAQPAVPPPPRELRKDMDAAEILQVCADRGIKITPHPDEKWGVVHEFPHGSVSGEEMQVLSYRRTDLYALLTGEEAVYGLCCACGKAELRNTINTVCLPFKGTVAGSGWGFPPVPFDGAITMLCPACAENGVVPVYAIAGAVPTERRVAIRELYEPWPPTKPQERPTS